MVSPHWLLWSHNATLVDEAGHIALDSKETIAALKYATELQKTMVSGTLSWNDSGNNKAFASGDIGLTFNGVSIYYFLKNSPDAKLNKIAADTQHQALPKGLATRAPMSATPMNAMVFKHTKYPNAAKDYLRFMMEAEQYGPWLSNCLGYWSNSLKAYSKMDFWTAGPEAGAIRSGHGHAVLRWLQGSGDSGILGGDRQLHSGGYVRFRRHRQCDAGGSGQARGAAGGSVLQDELTRAVALRGPVALARCPPVHCSAGARPPTRRSPKLAGSEAPCCAAARARIGRNRRPNVRRLMGRERNGWLDSPRYTAVRHRCADWRAPRCLARRPGGRS